MVCLLLILKHVLKKVKIAIYIKGTLILSTRLIFNANNSFLLNKKSTIIFRSSPDISIFLFTKHIVHHTSSNLHPVLIYEFSRCFRLIHVYVHKWVHSGNTQLIFWSDEFQSKYLLIIGGAISIKMKCQNSLKIKSCVLI